jgi:hypothetical protein
MALCVTKEKKGWLKARTPAHDSLIEIVTNKRFIKILYVGR